MPFAQVNGVSLYYEDSGGGEPLLLVAGQGSDHTMWDSIRRDFTSAGYRVITWDHRGTGQSDKPREPAYSVQGFAADAVGLLDHLGIQRAHAYGISMGGRICQWLAIDYPERFASVVLGCTTPGNAHGVRRPPEVDAHMANRPADPDELVRFLSEQVVSPAYLEKHPEYLEFTRRRAEHPIPAYAQKMHYLASERHDSWDRLPEIKIPTLVIHGTEDQINPAANAQLLAGRIPGAELRLIEGGRHGFFIEFREEASAAVLEFLARHSV